MNIVLSVAFSGCCESSGESCSISIVRDEERNGGKSSFELGDEIFYRVRPVGAYKYRTTFGGLVSVVSSHLHESISEDVVISGNSGNAKSLISANFHYEWLGSAINMNNGSYCHPRITAYLGTTILKLPYNVRGIAQLDYRSDYMLIKFVPMHTGKQLVEISPVQSSIPPADLYEFGNGLCGDELICSASYIVEDITTAEGGEQVALRIIDACNDDPVAGAQVFVDDVLVVGISDVDGNINVGFLSEGIHTIKIIASGYVPSDEDQLANDQIEV